LRLHATVEAKVVHVALFGSLQIDVRLLAFFEDGVNVGVGNCVAFIVGLENPVNYNRSESEWMIGGTDNDQLVTPDPSLLFLDYANGDFRLMSGWQRPGQLKPRKPSQHQTPPIKNHGHHRRFLKLTPSYRHAVHHSPLRPSHPRKLELSRDNNDFFPISQIFRVSFSSRLCPTVQ
jgi:hypothetical protein